MHTVILLTAPLLTGWLLGGLVANPVFTAIENLNPHAFEISERQKIEGAKDIHKAEMRMRMDAAIGRAPPLTYNELQVFRAINLRTDLIVPHIGCCEWRA